MYMPNAQFKSSFVKKETILSLKPLSSISVIGLGYVGLVSTACLSQMGHDVIGVDVCEDKLNQLAKGLSPIVEPGLDDLLKEGLKQKRISASADLCEAIRRSEVSFISVNTPTKDNGGCDCSSLTLVAKELGAALQQKDDYHVIVMRCSVPPGTTKEHFIPIVEHVSGKREGRDFGVCFNPEFLRESTAIADFNDPPKTVIGATHAKAAQKLAAILAPIDDAPILTDIETAEMVKYVDNVWHAAKVCFGNEIGRLCQAVGVDGWDVMEHFSRDTVLNISPQYLKPGFAYGGSCLPKEVRAMRQMGAQYDVSLPLIDSLGTSNRAQIQRAYELTKRVGAKVVGLCGITFKPDTNDLRESPMLDLAGMLLNDGIEILVDDPIYCCESKMSAQVRQLRSHYSAYADIVERLTFRLQPDQARFLAHSEALITAHNSPYWRKRLQGHVKNHHVIDLARLFRSPPSARSYHGIGW
ncbi:MAG: nucleotide sugar dehydrogenase [Cohaesibacter sp.]|nr:nucleotide sugar dehydrogenase [Cohaesibacter sp.]MCV6600308.1 nucleotide sugar dehydrogenase [Cohaesibacter sp.]